MQYDPWPLDERGRYRDPGPEEIRATFGIGGEALRNTLLHFEERGGDTERLLEAINSQVRAPLFHIDREALLDATRHYGNEYYFHFVMTAKKIIGSYDFHYGEGGDAQLGPSHRIYEKGFLDFEPCGEGHREVTIGLFKGFYSTYEKTVPRYPEILDWLEILVRQKADISFKEALFPLDNLWIDTELHYYICEFTKVLTNRNDMIDVIRECFNSFKFCSLTFMALQTFPLLMKRMLDAATNVYDAEIETGGKTIKIRFAWKASYDSRKFSHYLESATETVNKLCVGGFGVALRNSLSLSKAPRFEMTSAISGRSFSFRIDRDIQVTLGASALQLGSNAAVVAGILEERPGDALSIAAAAFIILLLNAAFALGFLLRRERQNVRIIQSHNATNIADKEGYIAELKGVSEALLAEKEKLEERVRERTAELAAANERLREQDRAKTDFFYNISHELRTPLTLIAAPLEEIGSGRLGTRLNYNDPLFAMLRRNCDRLRRQVANLLDFGKAERGMMDFSPRLVDLRALVNLYVSEVESAARVKELSLEFDAGIEKACPASVDPGLFEKAFFNILSNALKFTPASGKVKVDLVAEGGEVRVSIADTGIGIASERLDEIWKRFGQAGDTSTRRYEGSGIGLSLARELVELHGGRIEAESEPGAGSRFTIVLPLVRQDGRLLEIADPADAEAQRRRSILVADVATFARPAASPVAAKEGSGVAPRVLVVEDNGDLLDFLGTSLSRKFLVKTARNGREALAILDRGEGVDVIISDIMMAEMDGREFFSLVRERDYLTGTPFIFLTARASDKERIECVEGGAIDYVFKPFSMPELEAKLANVAGIARGSRNRARREFEHRVLKAIAGDDNRLAPRLLLEGFGLCEREKDIAILIAEGLSNKEIAARLGLSPQRIANVLSGVFRKTGAGSRAALVKLLA